MAQTSTSPKLNKVIVVYNTHFFESMYKLMQQHGVRMITDAGGTIWHITDVCNILLNPKKKGNL